MLGKRSELAQDLDAFLARHLHVEDHDVVRGVAQPRERRLPIADTLDLMPFAPELSHKQLAQPDLVVGDQHTDGTAHSEECLRWIGTAMRNTLPLPGRLCTSMRPP